MALALKALQDYDRRKEQRRRERLRENAALALEAIRRREETGEPVEVIIGRLIDENWQPE